MCLLLVCLVAATAAGASAQTFLPHRCQSATPVQGFDVAKYMGLWYEYEKVAAVFEAGGVCVTANYSLQSDGTVKVRNRQVDSSTGKPKEILGSAFLDNKLGEAKLKVIFPTEGVFKVLLLALQSAASVVRPIPVNGNIAAPYWVLSTDYRSYSVVWSCVNLGASSIQFAWVLTRDPSPGESVLQTINQVLKENGLQDLPLKLTPQTCS
ncbi:apolipoprotein D-like [Bacillus rossius redtenbacheri]|uniref:apolipoprotein D-like n=1 Tax=Bacillus rossius redtenbacheri TaxID=93214 RepID=UPI002FDD1337